MSRLCFLMAIGSLLWASVGLACAQDPEQMIAFASRETNANEDKLISDIFTIQLNGENRRNLSNHPANDIEPDWSPDGRRIAFSSNRDGDYDIWIMDADGSNIVKAADSDRNEFYPRWSPDGAHILCSQRDGHARAYWINRDICLISLADGRIATLTNELSDDYDGAWSLDGSSIVFVSEYDTASDTNGELYTLSLDDAKSLNRLTYTKDNDARPHWISENEILYITYSGVYVLSLQTLERKTILERDMGFNPKNTDFDIGIEDGILQILAEGSDGLWYINLESEAQFIIGNTSEYDDSMSWRSVVKVPAAGTD